MNKEKLISLINNPTNISNEDLEALKKLADEYPYFQIAHTLIAKTLGENKSLAFKNRLHYASITSPDRNILKKVIEGHAISYATSTAAEKPAEEVVKETAPVKEEVKKEEKATDILKDRLAEIEGSAAEEHLSDIIIPSSTVSSKDALKITNDSADNKLLNELEENLKSLQKAKQKNAQEAKTKKAATNKIATPTKVKVKAVSKKVTSTKKVTPKSKTTPVKKAPRKKVATTKSPVKKIAAKKATPVKKITVKKAVAAKKPIRKIATIKKAAPVKKMTSKKTVVAKKATQVKAPTKKAAAKKTTTRKATTKTTTKKKLPNKVTTKSSVRSQSKIIDAFIKKEPKIRPKKPSLKVKEKPQKDLSVESTKIKNDLVSENLAIIMEKQGKIAKAKDIYKKLIWKFPQKKAYFATRIKELDKK